MSDILTGKEAKQQISKTLVEFLKKNTDGIKRLLEREAKGRAKLEKSLKKDEGAGFLPDLGKTDVPAASCSACGSNKLEPLGSHRGMDHSLCKDCGEVGASKGMAKAELAKVTPPGISEKTAHKIKDEYGEDEEGKRKAYATMWAIEDEKKKKERDKKKVEKGEASNEAAGNRATMTYSAEAGPRAPGSKFYSSTSSNADKKLRGESNPDSFTPGASQKYGAKAFKAELPTNAPKPQTVENVRQGAGMSAGIPKMPSVKKSSIPKGLSKPKDAFNTGGMNPTTAAAMGKGEIAPGSGGDIKKEELNKNFFGLPIAAPPPNPQATAHVKAMRERAAQRHSGGGSLKPIRAGFDPGITKWKDQQARDVQVVGKMMGDKAKHEAKQAKIAGASSAPAPAAMGKAEGIPEAPKAPNTATQAQSKPAAATPAPTPAKQSPAL